MIRLFIDADKALLAARAFCLHTSAFGFGADFAHAVMGEHMILASAWEAISHYAVTWACVGATLMCYIDGMREKRSHRKGAG